MSAIAAFVLGLLAGWIIEWIIDWIYWRRKASASLEQEALLREQLQAAEAHSAELEHQLSIQKANLASLQEKLSNAAPAVPVRSMPVVQDDLVVIKGIGPVIAGKLNQAGIYSFADLAALTPERLRELVGKMISQLADEEAIIEQARKLAAEKSQGA
jgi:predicted flap endonuclease-1-like 5' DNA nuclease